MFNTVPKCMRAHEIRDICCFFISVQLVRDVFVFCVVAIVCACKQMHYLFSGYVYVFISVIIHLSGTIFADRNTNELN